jgi:hypothetical protein
MAAAALLALALFTALGDDAPGVVERFLTREEAVLERYHATRRMTARNPRFRKEGWVDAATSLDPVGGFRFEVVASGGAPIVVNRVLLASLRGEAEMWRSGEPGRHALTRDNYEFVAATSGGDGADDDAVRVPIRPLRKHVLLVDGALFLSPQDGDLLRVEGRLSKSPSFWVSRVDVVRRYARIAGVRVPVELQSVAHVRLAGRSEMQITYQYSSINGQPVVR